MKFLIILPALLLIPAASEAQAVPREFQGATPLEWSQRLAKSEMARRGKAHFKDGSATARWEYTSGLFGHALFELGRTTGDKETATYAAELVTSFVGADGGIATYRESDYNLDMIVPGRVVLAKYRGNRRKTAQTRRRKCCAASSPSSRAPATAGSGTSSATRRRCGSTASTWAHPFSPNTARSSTNRPPSMRWSSRSC